MARRRIPRGVTLIELLVAVALVAILAGVAYPAYTRHLVRSHRASAQTVLSDIAQRQQQYLMDNRAFATTPAALGVNVPGDLAGRYSFQITADASMPPSYTATATPVAGSPQAVDGPLSITSEGTRLPPDKW